jgi:hypothetical protein
MIHRQFGFACVAAVALLGCSATGVGAATPDAAGKTPPPAAKTAKGAKPAPAPPAPPAAPTSGGIDGRTPRLALVIGNAAYGQQPLKNPTRDASEIATRLERAGFAVTLRLDATRQQFIDAINAFAKAVGDKRAVGVFYFAGHGLQLNWRNFLVPVDAKIRAIADIQAQTVDLGALVAALSRARNPLNVIVLDACRDNPFGKDYLTDDKGLTQIDAPPGTLLAYATSPGIVAADGEGENGLYTENLLREILVPGAKVEDVFKRVRLGVRRTSKGAQVPWESTSLEDDFYFMPPPAAQKTVPEQAQREFEADLAQWLQLRQAGDINAIENFLRTRPSGKFSELADHRLDELLRKQGERTVRPTGQPQCACAGNPYAEEQAYRVGDRFLYYVRDLLGGGFSSYGDTVTGLDGEDVLFNGGSTVTDRYGNFTRDPEGRKWTPYQFYIPEYKLGKRWQAQFIVTEPSGEDINVTFNVRAATRERITLPAGTFDTYRLEAEGRNLKTGALITRTAWVAPETVPGYVAVEQQIRLGNKVILSDRTELKEFRRAGSVAAPAARPTGAAASSTPPVPATPPEPPPPLRFRSDNY